MDVLNCRIIDVGGRMYRVQSVTGTLLKQESQEDELSKDVYHEEEDDSALEGLIDESLIQADGDGYLTKVSADAELLPFIVGREGSSKKKVEQDTGTSIWVPRKNHEGISEVIIRGPTRQSVSSARVGVEVLIDNALGSKRLDYNFFLSLPLTQPHVVANYERVMEELCATPWAAECAIEERLFMKPQHLHLTLVMLKLYSDEARHRAKQVLQGMREDVARILAGKPLTVALKGLQYMNDDPSAMHVLYLKVEEPNAGSRLAGLCDLVVRSFAEAGLLQPQDERPVKLHATMLNSRYRQRSSSSEPAGGGNRFGPAGSASSGSSAGQRRGGNSGGQLKLGQDRVPFDGRRLLNEKKDLELGTLELKELHLSQRGAYDSDGYYHCAHKLALMP